MIYAGKAPKGVDGHRGVKREGQRILAGSRLELGYMKSSPLQAMTTFRVAERFLRNVS